ncbi:rhodanese-like domain-containing protein [Arthrobacter sp. JSM 101049]|uniref:rhodanese-like domain-containing protein n=1 Tax=Arthrobacter sp. JSM 101049 TaxID=929097 RepID=UPI003565C1EA
MYFERIYDTDLAHASYLIGCQATGEAVVVDPRRDIAIYQRTAQANGLRITAVTETHVHADYVSGTRELAAATGAALHVSGEGGPGWQYAFEAGQLHDGDTIALGNITLTAVHTPGHTPEHLSFLVTDGAFADEPGYLLSGDFVFCGDLGRPDLLDEAAGGKDTRFAGARQMFASLRDTFLALPDHVQVHPAHGAGSACGKALGAVPSTTVGYERLHAWWGTYLAANDEDGFITELLEGQPDAPAYFGRMKRQNLAGPPLLGERGPLHELAPQEVARDLAAAAVVFVDTRAQADVHAGTVAGALNLPATGALAGQAAWVIDPERETRPLVLLATGPEAAAGLRERLLRVGIDDVAGYTTTLEGLPTAVPQLVRVDELAGCGAALLLDVRAAGEHSAGNIPGSQQLHGGRVLWNLDRLPEDGTIVTYCQSGVRSSVVASALRRAGYDVAELEGSYAAWATAHPAGAEVVPGPEPAIP